ncbi:hypothetical protein NCS52_01539200 [Fusarium sp. LHS14.1]|nr:hypothetical protein NCS52_01539200 [Fusarium sp. LHS14.1]
MTDPGFDGVGKNTPLLTAAHPKMTPSPSPPPDILSSTHISSAVNNEDDGGRGTGGDATLIRFLTDGRDIETIHPAGEKGLPPDQDDKEDLKNVTLPLSQAPEKPMLKRLREATLAASEQDNGQILHPARRRAVSQPDNETCDGHPNEGSLTNFSKRGSLAIYDDVSSSGELS